MAPCARVNSLPQGPWLGEYIDITPDIAHMAQCPVSAERAHAVGRALSGILRHGHCLKLNTGVKVVRPDGFIAVSLVQQALRQKNCGDVSLAELEAAVDFNDKCRFQLLSRQGSNTGPIIAIRATYAHSLSAVEDEWLHMPVNSDFVPRYLYHASFNVHVDSIMADGLIPGGKREAPPSFSAGRGDAGPAQSEWRSHVFFSPVPPGHPGFHRSRQVRCCDSR